MLTMMLLTLIIFTRSMRFLALSQQKDTSVTNDSFYSNDQKAPAFWSTVKQTWPTKIIWYDKQLIDIYIHVCSSVIRSCGYFPSVIFHRTSTRPCPPPGRSRSTNARVHICRLAIAVQQTSTFAPFDNAVRRMYPAFHEIRPVNCFFIWDLI